MRFDWQDTDEVRTEAEKAKKQREAEREEEARETDERRKKQKEDDFEPGSDMHTWATTRFF